MAKELTVRICRGPECPACGEDGFDDWHHDPTCRGGGGVVVSLYARLKCHGCGKFFSVTHYVDGITHSTMNRRKAA